MLSKERVRELKIFSKKIQIETVKMIANLGVGHLGGSLSIADALAVLYGAQMKYDPKNPKWEERDWFVCSKGHAGPAVYAALAMKGFFPMSELNTLNRPGTRLPSHCDRLKTPGIDMTTGSLGQGASTAAGIALAHQMNKKSNKVFLMLGDGEINEGQVWEMALFAGTKKINNLIAFVDYNKLQLDGPTCEICDVGNVAKKFEDFGWFAQDIDGRDVLAINNAIESARAQHEKPSMIVLNTIKGDGWSSVANKSSCHNLTISPAQLEEAMVEMNAALKRIEEGE
ncbi:MAG: transketolase [Christensenella sp.]|nr:transketolase [Christensenella sp.]